MPFSLFIDADMRELWELQRQNADALRATGRGDLLLEPTADATLHMRDVAKRLSPYWTGTASSAHRGKAMAVRGGAEGRVFLDPHVVSPVTGDRPVVYMIDVAKRKPWLEWAVEQEGDKTLEMLGDDILGEIEGYYG